MFARLEAWFNAFFLGYAARVSADLAAGLVPIALIGLTVYIAIYGFAVMRGEATEPLATFFWKMVKVGAIFSFALPGLAFSANVIGGANALQDGMANLFLAPGGAPGGTAFAALDAANNAANAQLRLLWADAGITRLDLVLASILFSLGTVIFLVLGAFTGLLAKLILTFILAIGPLAILCLLFKSTSRFFDSWLSSLLSAVVLSWFVFFALGMSLFVSGRLIAAIRDGAAFLPGAGAGGVNALEAAGTYLAVMVLLAIVLYQAPSLASALTGGASIQSGSQMVTNTMVAMRMGSGGGAAGGSAGASGATGGSVGRGAGAGYSAGRAAASGARAAYQQVAQRGRAST